MFWVDEANNENTRAYEAQVLLLAESREELEHKKSNKRVPMPKIRMEEHSDDDKRAKKQDKQVSQKRKFMQVNARSASYSRILEKHVQDAKKKAMGEQSSEPNHQRRSPKKPHWECDTSSSDESLISSAELRKEIAEKKMWKERSLKLEKENEVLLEQVASLQRCLESKIFQVEALHRRNNSMEGEGIHAKLGHVAKGRGKMEQAISTSQEGDHISRVITEDDDLHVDKNDQGNAQDHFPSIPVPGKDFVHLPDGSFHLAEGIVISANQAAKILNNKKATLVCKDTAHAIWGTDGLLNRSVSGVAAPKLRAAGELPKQPLTPTKVNVVTATVRHWGQLKGEDVTTAVASITKLLSEKIQDVRKSSKRLALAKERHSM